MVLKHPPLPPATSPISRLPSEWEEALAAWGEPKFRGGQIFRWVHQRGVIDPQAMTDLSKGLRARLEASSLALPLETSHVHASEDGTRKLLVKLEDGKEIETVLLPQGRADADEDGDENTPDADAVSPITQCISTQVGCAMGCVFCASGIAGLKRHLTAAEIVGQLLLGRSLLGPGERLRNVVLMGMGEPLHNYAQVARALVLMTHPDGLGLSTRRVTLSTSGLVPEIDRLGEDFGGQIQLAISLHAVTDDKRSKLMPINRKHPIAELLACLRRYPLPKRRRITIEYTLIAGQNDDVRDADTLSDLLRGIPVKVNLIPMNPVEASALSAPDFGGVEAFQARLRERGVATFIRQRRGDDISAACGQLVLPNAKRKVRVHPDVR